MCSAAAVSSRPPAPWRSRRARSAPTPAPELLVTTPMPAPEWALLQRELLRAHTEACEIFHAQVLRRAQSPAVLPALGHERRTRRRHRARQRLAAAACARRFGSHPRAVSRRVRRTPRAVRRAAHEETCPWAARACTCASSRRRWTGSTSAKACPSSISWACRRRTTPSSSNARAASRASTTAATRPRPTTTRSIASSAACSTAAWARCSARPPRSTGPAIPSTPRVSSWSTASATSRSSSRTSRNTPTPSATARSTCSPPRWRSMPIY